MNFHSVPPCFLARRGALSEPPSAALGAEKAYTRVNQFTLVHSFPSFSHCFPSFSRGPRNCGRGADGAGAAFRGHPPPLGAELANSVMECALGNCDECGVEQFMESYVWFMSFMYLPGFVTDSFDAVHM